MDNRSFLNTLAKTARLDTKTANRLTEKLGAVIAEILSEEDSVAIPGFGNFIPVTTDEQIETDPKTKTRRLIPPSVKPSFIPASRLKKTVEEK